jgi:hypothetical protein
MHNPNMTHLVVVKRILHYLKGSLDHGLSIRFSSDFTLHAYSDSDWACYIDDRKSTMGYLVFFGPNLITWCSKKQPNVVCSSIEVEYQSLTMATAELVWLQSLLQELCLVIQSPVLWCDNLGATFLATNLAFHARMKHIKLEYHFVRKK